MDGSKDDVVSVVEDCEKCSECSILQNSLSVTYRRNVGDMPGENVSRKFLVFPSGKDEFVYCRVRYRYPVV